VTLIAHTEGKLYGVVDRLNRLDLFRYFSKVYCRERSQSPHPNPRLGAEWLARVPKDKIVELSRHQAKPDPAVLLEICEREGAKLQNVSYIGDSIARDILMAKRANVFSIWAAYGARHSRRMYSRLVRISHWTNEEVVLEQRLTKEAERIQPDYVAYRSFAEVLTAISIKQSTRRA
jgi:phosphoglycolate phosphatase